MNKLGKEIVNAIWDTDNVDPSKLSHQLAVTVYNRIMEWFDKVNPNEIRVFVSKSVCKKSEKTEERYINHIKSGDLRFVESSKVKSIYDKAFKKEGRPSTVAAVCVGYQNVLRGSDEYLFLNSKDVLMIIQKLK